ncbi:MAG: GTP cyclohydrolase II [Alphaproteobacteria bacterium]|nr:GTP cyclohydrolase II [Alphaproteobacteria bacterium]
MPRHIRLTSHPGDAGRRAVPLHWGAPVAAERGPVVASPADPQRRNAIGSYSGAYAIYRALAVATRALARDHRPDLTDTAPAARIAARPQWAEATKIVSMDPWGHLVGEVFAEHLRAGIDARPTIAITKARLATPELRPLLAEGRLRADGQVLLDSGETRVTKAAIDPVWYLPGVATRFGVSEPDLRRTLFEETGGMFPELITRPDLDVLLPPIGGTTVYFFGEVERLAKPGTVIACRVHDECNGSDVFGSDICTCRPYLIHGIEVCVDTAQQGGVGIIVYNRKEGRALGEVTKFLVYNARKRQPGGDTVDSYFRRTECVAGVQDMRFQELMPDVFHWLGVRRIDRWVSMSNVKRDALEAQGINVVEQLAIPDRLVPLDAAVEIEAKKASGYFSPSGTPDPGELRRTKGRALGE